MDHGSCVRVRPRVSLPSQTGGSLITPNFVVSSCDRSLDLPRLDVFVGLDGTCPERGKVCYCWDVSVKGT